MNVNKKTQSLALVAVLVAVTLLLGLTQIGIISIPPANVTIMHIPVIIGTIVLGLKPGLILGGIFGLTSVYKALIAPSLLVAPLLGQSVISVIVMSVGARLLIPIVVYFVHKGVKKLLEKARAATLGATAILVLEILFLGVLLGITNSSLEEGAKVLARSIIVVVQAILIPFLVYLLLRRAEKNKTSLLISITAAAGTLTNTICYLGIMLFFYILFGLGSSAVLGVIIGAGALNGSLEAIAAILLCTPIVVALQKMRKSEKE